MRRNTHFLQRIFLTILTVAMFVLPVRTSPAQQTAEAPVEKAPQKSLDERLEALVEKLEKARVEHHVPGIGIAIVKDGEVVLCTGLGQANIEKDIKATGDTVFAIGSCTKAFTATLCGVMVDEGKMDWDDKVSKHLPNFVMRDETANAEVTIRDLLCHRTGLSRMDLLWASGALTRDEILAAVERAEPMHEFREKFEYSNTNFVAAGEAAARAGGDSWEALTRDHLLKPLLMTNSTLSIVEAKENPKLAIGYSWDDESESFELDPMRDIISAAPAGSINSSARDMANWVLMQLNRGEFNGSQVISEKNLTETWESHIGIAGPVGYGLGWMVREWKDKRFIEHGGNIDGFAASVGFLPDDNLGYVLLMNVSFTQLQFLGGGLIFDTLLGDEPAQGAVAGEIDYEAYLGKYIADFGPFKDQRFTVQVKNGNLAVDVPGQTVYELKPPDENGKWSFAITDAIAVSFDRDDAGEIRGMRMYQSGATMKFPKEGYDWPAVSPAEVQDYLGTYHLSVIGNDTKVMMQGDQLAIDVPGQKIYQLYGPDEEGKWEFLNIHAALRFNRNAAGDVESATLLQNGQEMPMPRVANVETDQQAADAGTSMTLDDVMALHYKATGGENVENIKTVRMTGTIRFVNQGIDGTIEILAKGMTHYHNAVDLGRSGTIDVIVAGDQGWSASSFDRTEVLQGKYLKSAQRQHPLLLVADWRDMADVVELQETKMINKRSHHIVRVKLDDTIDSEVAVDAATGLVTGENITLAVRHIGSLPMTLRYNDHRMIEGGLMLPATIEISNPFHGKAVIEFDSIEINVDLPDDAFDPPADVENDAKTAATATP